MSPATLRTLIVDDEPPARELLASLLARVPGVQVVESVGSVAAALSAIRQHTPDLLLLDVELHGESGFDVVQTVEPARLPITIVVTAFDDYAIGAFEVAALDYLLKPVEDARLTAAVERARQQLALRESEALGARLRALIDEISVVGARAIPPPARGYLDRIPVEMRGQIRVVRVEDIHFITASGVYADLHMNSSNRTYPVRISMQELEDRLDPRSFMRVHRSCIVQLDQIDYLQRGSGSEYCIVLRDGSTLPLSRAKVCDLETWMGVRPTNHLK